MSTMRKVFVVIASATIVLVAVAYLLPRQVHVERETLLAAPPSDVFALVNDFKQFTRWSPWAALDPDTRYTFEGGTQGEGAKMIWYSDHPNVGSGSQEIIESVENQHVKVALDFGSQGQATAYYRLSPSESGTRLVWGFDSDLGNNPVARYFGLFFDGMIGEDYEKGLNNLKSLIEHS